MKFANNMITARSLGLIIALISPEVYPAGFRLPEVSIAGIGASSALVANAEEPGAIPYNPATMAFHESSTFVAGISQVRSNFSATPLGGSKTDALRENSSLIPNVSYAQKLRGNIYFGVNVNSPFGLETEWPDNTFPGFGGFDAVEPALTGLEMININPNLAYKFNGHASIALGLNYYDILNADLNTHGVHMSGDGNNYGWNIAMIDIHGPLTVGLSYRSSVETDINGTFNVPGVFAVPASTEVEFPSMLQLGVRFKFNSKWDVEFDFDRENWESFDSLIIQNSNTGAIITASTFNWENANTYRFNVNYVISDKALLRLGAGFAESPVSGGALFSVATPTGDRDFLSVGFRFDFDALSLDLGYLYVMSDDINFNSSIPYTGGEANGTSVYNGLYEFSAHEFGIGIQAKF